jgi:two-component system, chemotaxis family, protein-glutamate methylesterase/glutaminase
MIKVLVVDDSKVVQELLKYIFSSDPEISVIGVAGSGNEAIALTKELRPDVITMDLHMPGMNGFEAIRIIMETSPTPIVIISGSLNNKDVANSLNLLEDGALAVVLRPPGINNPDYQTSSQEILRTVKLMSEIKVVKLFPRQRKLRGQSEFRINPESCSQPEINLIAIGASTGGPVALQKILSRLNKDLPVPVLIVQHIASGFTKGFVEWLSGYSGIPLKLASDGEYLKAGVGYIAPDGYHMGVQNGMRIILSSTPPENGLRPSVDYLFRTVANISGSNSIGVLLTGMGKDGAIEMKNMKERGAITIAQDSETSVVFGMPAEAIKLGAVDNVLPVEKIAVALIDFVKKSKKN